MRALFLSGCALVLCASSSWAGPLEDGQAVSARWAEVFVAEDLDAIVGLYKPDALFWPTTSREMANSPDPVRAYFTNAFANPNPATSVVVASRETRVLSDTIVVDAGTIELTRVVDGAPRVTPVRFHFVYENVGGSWLIAAHHSSAMPAPPAAPAAPAAPAPATPPR
jgi:uncharacterized protein (TIGR02246 family)